MFDFTNSELKVWRPVIPVGQYEFVSSRMELGELAVKLVRRSKTPGDEFACELVSRPLWHCVVSDEQFQEQLVVAGPGDMFEVLMSPVIAGFSANEIVFQKLNENVRHWVIMTLQECVHIVAAEEPEFRVIYGESV